MPGTRAGTLPSPAGASTRVAAPPAALGEGRYDPQLDPATFDDDFANPAHPNPYFPLRIGNHWQYKGGFEVNTMEVLNEKKVIEGVPCVVVRDVVEKGGRLTEDTNDWYAQAKDTTVW